MRAVQVTRLEGPDALEIKDIPEPMLASGNAPDDVLVRVQAVGVSFPDLLLTRGQYQLKPEVPFTLGVDFAGTVVSGGGFDPGTRVVGVAPYGGAAELVVSPRQFTFAIPDSLSMAEGAALPMNYLTAHFTLAVRGQTQPGETVLIHGAAGGVGTACIQVAKGLGARTIAVCSTQEKAAFAKQAGADEAILLDGFKDKALALTGGTGVDVIVDVVGGEVFTDSLRTLNALGRLMVVGFAAGQGIPEVKVNRLLLNNIDVRGVGWGGYAMTRPGYMQEQWAAIEPMIKNGTIRPPIGATYRLEDFGLALTDMDERRTLGKSVVTFA